jgi:hypothetical protein
MAYTKSSPEWRDIIVNSDNWFEPTTMKWWNSKVLWDSLTPVLNGRWLFLSLEDTFDRTERKYSLRLADLNAGDVDTLSFQQTSDIQEAYHLLNEYSFELGSC